MSFIPRGAGFLRANRRKFPPVAALFVLAFALFAVTPQTKTSAQVPISSDVVISQVYTRGGEPGALYAFDYVELFNRGDSPVDINRWTLQLETKRGSLTSASTVGIFSPLPVIVEPGKYVLIQLGGDGMGGAPLPVTPDHTFPGRLNIGPDGGRISLVRNGSGLLDLSACPSPRVDTADFVGFGPAARCWEGTSPAPAPDAASALMRARGGCTDDDQNATDFQLLAPNPRNSATPKTTCALAGGPNVVQFSRNQFIATEAVGHFPAIVTRTGDATAEATVLYSVTKGTADERQDFTTTWGRLRFAPGETVKTFDVLLTNDAAAESDETIALALASPVGATLGPRFTATAVVLDDDTGAAATNPADDPAFFARQHYHDFFSRAPDPLGFVFWTNQATNCDNPSVEVCRVNVSGAFFLSTEFQETGFLVYRLYRAAFPESAARPRGMPRYAEFLRDTQTVGQGIVDGEVDWRLRLDARQREFTSEFVERAEFRALYPATMTAAQYVDALNANAGGHISAQLREQMIFNLNSGAFTRAEVLRMVAENRQFVAQERNRAFVLTQYFGYLRRNPDDAPNTSFAGYDFWLTKLNDHGGDFVAAEMVKAFIT
ncbi:MAG TPA: Calx-beta domain-containing protein, partial [Pyrinomonadaceae bacterium]|nr:Calx-beta domain-containing protein [Pyrinomonadaceae bacterium]